MPLFYTSPENGAMGMGSLLIPLIVMVALMYFLLFSRGNVGKTLHVADDNIVIETSDDRVRMELAKWAVSTNNSNPPETKKGKKENKAEEPAQIGEELPSGPPGVRLPCPIE